MDWCRAAKYLFVAWLLLVCLQGSHVRAQGLPFMNWAEAFSLRTATISPTLRLGYERVGLSFNLPLPGGNGLDLSLKDANLGMAGLGILATFGDPFAIFANAEATFMRNLDVLTQEEPYHGGSSAVSWTGSQFQLGQIEAGLLYKLTDGISLVGGLRRSRFLMSVKNPTDAFGPINFSEIVALSFTYDPPGPLGPFTFNFTGQESQRYFGDFDTSIWTPLFGVRLTGPNFRVLLLGSPISWVQLCMPLRLQQGLGADFSISASRLFFLISDQHGAESEIRYNFNRTGVFLEGNFEYDVRLASRFMLNLWARGSWTYFSGSGLAGYTLNLTDQDRILLQVRPLLNWITLLDINSVTSDGQAASASNQGSLKSYNYLVGVSAVVSF